MPQAPNRARILVAEDDEDLREALVAALADEPWTVEVAPNGAVLLDRLASALLAGSPRPDVIVTDVRMPGITGLEVLAGLRANGWRVPIVLMTGFGSRDLYRAARRLGAAAVLDKPFDVNHLRALIRSLVAGIGAEAV